ncbi:MAG: hypothetical protein ACK2U2_06180 [Anaerolineae bacterium]
MLSLTDPAWGELQSTYGDGTHVAELLARAESGVPFDRWYDDLFQELCHQYTVSEAAYAALPHLVALARENGEARKHLLVLAGCCYAFAQLPDTELMPAEWEPDWQAAARDAIPLIAEVLSAQQLAESDLRYLFVSLAAFHGHRSLALSLEALDAEVECPNCGTVFEPTNPLG